MYPQAQILLCERVLHEADGTDSVVRIIDRSVFPFPAPRQMGYGVKVAVYVRLIGGDRVYDTVLRVSMPNGREFSHTHVQAHLPDPAAIATFSFDFEQTLPVLGTYWFEVHFDGQVHAATPLTVEVLGA